MKKPVFLLIFFLMVFAGLAKDVQPIKKGLSFFVKKNYSKAIQEFENSKIKSPGVYYNIALAHWEKGDRGYAILYLKKALKRDPFYKKAKIALSQIKNQEEKKSFPDRKIILIGFLLFYFILNLYLFFSILKIIRFKKLVFAFFIILFFLTIPFVLKNNFLLIGQSKAIIIEKGKVNLYSEPDDNSLVIYSLREGEEVELLSELGGWYQIKKGEAYFGWLKASVIKKL